MLESFKNVPTKSISLKTYYIEGVLQEPAFTEGLFTDNKKYTIFTFCSWNLVITNPSCRST